MTDSPTREKTWQSAIKIILPAAIAGVASVLVARINSDAEFQQSKLGYKELADRVNEQAHFIERQKGQMEILTKIALEAHAQRVVAVAPVPSPGPTAGSSRPPSIQPRPVQPVRGALLKTLKDYAENKPVEQRFSLKRVPSKLDDL